MRGEVTTDLVENARRMVQDFVVRQTKHGEACGREPSVAAAVARWSGEVRSAICFEHEARFFAEEVDDEWSDGMLSAELGLHDTSGAQHLPKLLFGGSGTASQSTRLQGSVSEQAGHAWLSATRRSRLPQFLFPTPLSLRERGWG
jgi:hypothetical protein